MIEAEEWFSGEKPDVFGLRAYLKERLIGQDHAIDELCDSVENAECNLGRPGKSRPRGSFLAVGTTGVGKTETARLLAKYMWREEQFHIFDMSEFQHEDSISVFVGNERPRADGTGKNIGRLGEVLSQWSDRGGVLVFDEIEKANRRLLTLFLQMLEPGTITCGVETKFDLSPFFIFLTSNIGAEDVMHSTSEVRQLTLERQFRARLSGALSPELTNRIDSILVYKKLSAADLRSITRLHLESYLKAIAANHGLPQLSYDADVVNWLMVRGYDRWFGARPIVRAVERYVAAACRERIKDGLPPTGRLVVGQGKLSVVDANRTGNGRVEETEVDNAN